MGERVRYHVIIKGQVQGVFFRSEARDKARRLHLTGWVMNLPDGSVEAVFEGSTKGVDEMLEFCGKGPSGARVDHVDVRRERYKEDLVDFGIRH